jgi:hypothetical protein
MVSMPVPGVKGTMILMGAAPGCAQVLQASSKVTQPRAKRWAVLSGLVLNNLDA